MTSSTTIFIDELKRNKLSITCKTISISRQSAAAPIKYVVTGKIYQNESGALELEAIWLCPTAKEFKPTSSTELCYSVSPGEIIPPDCYFEIEALSVSGKTWKARDIYLTCEAYHQTYTAIFRANLDSLTSESRRGKGAPPEYRRVIICDGKNIRIPANEFSDLGEQGKRRDTARLTINGTDHALKKDGDNLAITIASPRSISDISANATLEAIELATGQRLAKIYEINKSQNKTKEVIYTKENKENLWQIPNPIPCRSPTHIAYLTKFINKYKKLKKSERDYIIWYWREIGTSSNTAEALTKSVCSNIEGMIDIFHQSLRIKDIKFSAECKAAIPILEQLNLSAKNPLSERVIGKINSSLKDAGKASTKAILYELFGKDIADNWNNLRHAALHGSLHQLYKDEGDLFAKIYGCLYIFYELIADAISYKDFLINYSQKGYPNTLPQIQAIKNPQKPTSK
ncbi:hypothetical protein [Pseudomonas sp. PL-6]